MNGQDACAGNVDFDNSAAGVPDGTSVAFVGRKVFVEKANVEHREWVTLPTGERIERVIPRFNDRFEARFDVLQAVTDEPTGPTVDFVALDHFGRAAFQHPDVVLLFLTAHEGQWFHHKYLFHEVFRTTDGDWGICGSPQSGSDPEVAASFSEPLAFTRSVLDGNGDRCTHGTRAARLFDFYSVTRFQPEARRRACNAELGISADIIAGTGSHPSAREEGRQHAACVARREAQDAFR